MEFNRWWGDDRDERFWLEITDRKNLGIDLRAPQSGQDGRPKWQYALINEVRSGDIVFHYSELPGETAGICAWSRAVGEVWQEPIIWPAHTGDHPGGGRREPGWRLCLEGYFPVRGGVITLEAIRSLDQEIRAIEARLRERFGRPTYAPFEAGNRPIHPFPAYLTKMPREMVMLFPGTAEVAALELEDPKPVPTEAHRTYRRTNEHVLVSDRNPFSVDPALVERGLRAHAQAQNELADFLEWHGIRPLSPAPTEPNFDLAFAHEDVLIIVEVKALAGDIDRQLQIGVGQVLRYAQLMAFDRDMVVPALALDREPPADWLELAASVGVMVGWPGDWARLLPDPTSS